MYARRREVWKKGRIGESLCIACNPVSSLRVHSSRLWSVPKVINVNNLLNDGKQLRNLRRFLFTVLNAVRWWFGRETLIFQVSPRATSWQRQTERKCYSDQVWQLVFPKGRFYKAKAFLPFSWYVPMPMIDSCDLNWKDSGMNYKSLEEIPAVTSLSLSLCLLPSEEN